MNQVTEYWNEALKIIEEESSSLVSFETWIMPLVPIEIEGNNFILQIGDSFYKEMIEKRYMALIKNSIKKVTSKEYNILIFTEEELKERNNPKKVKETKPVNNVESVGNLNPRYVFSSFVTLSKFSPAPPSGSLIILSIIPKSFKSFAVIFIFSAASLFFEASLYKMLAKPSGDNIE